MKILVWLLLAIGSQAVVAGCPRKDITEYTYMSEDELISEYCSEMLDSKENVKTAIEIIE